MGIGTTEEVKPELAEDEEEKAAVQKEGEIEKVVKVATVVKEEVAVAAAETAAEEGREDRW